MIKAVNNCTVDDNLILRCCEFRFDLCDAKEKDGDLGVKSFTELVAEEIMVVHDVRKSGRRRGVERRRCH